jgi:hypothetical protein
MIGLLARICLSTSLIPSPSPPASRRLWAVEVDLAGSSTEAKYRSMNFAETVFPAPLHRVSHMTVRKEGKHTFLH